MGTWVLVLILHAGTGTSMTNVFGFANEAVCTAVGERWANRNQSTHEFHCLEVKGNGEG